MPRLEVPATSGNVNIATLLSAALPATGWGKVSYQADPDNGSNLLIGGSALSATNYDMELSAGDSAPDGNRLLRTRYVRNESASPQHLIVNFE